MRGFTASLVQKVGALGLLFGLLSIRMDIDSWNNAIRSHDVKLTVNGVEGGVDDIGLSGPA